jgi:DNA mismatch repair protein MutL
MVRSGKIQILPEHIAQAIAAGEVIERPASIVKELMENAIDAGSSEITIELKAGGLQLIRVRDNGEGMDPEDVPLALQRYATSKIRKVEDLFAIHTLGFRGEALPSIASVSQLTITTRVPHSISGTKVICEGGKIKSISEGGCPIGTEVEVKKLFYNVPVKRKFLKSIRSELRHSLSHFIKFSLSFPLISFKFIHDGRMLHELLKTESPLVRIEAILGREVYHHLQAFEWEEGGTRISGFTSLPTISKGNTDGIYLFVNQRFVKDRMVTKAILEAYRHVIPMGKFPIVLLWVTLPPYAVDVNIHPTKAEVKFKDPDKIYQTVFATIRMVLEKGPHLSKEIASQDEKRGLAFQEKVQPSFLFQESLPPYSSITGKEEKGITMVREGSKLQWEGERLAYTVLGQIQGTYILCEGEGNLIFIDQHAAHERILFEKFKKEYETRSMISERLIVPILIELSLDESSLLDSAGEAFQAIGFEIESLGRKLYAIRAIPSFIDQKDPKELLREILDEISFLRGEGKRDEIIHNLLVTLSCHSAIRGNFMLRKEEIDGLLKSLHPFNHSATCPHGRPIFFILPLEELNKKFKRKPKPNL